MSSIKPTIQAHCPKDSCSKCNDKAAKRMTGLNCKNHAGGKIVLSNGSAVDYDWLVLSMGSESSTLGIQGVKDYAVLFNTINDATQVCVKVPV